MLANVRSSCSALVLLTLAVVLSGCKTPDPSVYQRTWSEKWTDAVSSWKTPNYEKQHQALPEAAPNKSDEKMMAAVMLEREGKLDRAITVYEEILTKDKRRGDVHHHLAQLYDINGQTDKAEKHYQAAIKLSPKNTDILCDFGYHYYLAEKPDKAEKVLRQAIEQQPALARAHNNLGLVLAKSERFEDALAEFRSAGCDNSSAHVNLAYALMWDEHWVQAQHHIQMALVADPSSRSAQNAQISMSSAMAAVQRREQSHVMQTNFADGNTGNSTNMAGSLPQVR